jgi:hypothetical protein
VRVPRSDDLNDRRRQRNVQLLPLPSVTSCGSFATGKTLQPGELLYAYPPLSTAQAANGVQLTAVPAAELHLFQSGLARQMNDLPEGASLRIVPSWVFPLSGDAVTATDA